MSYLQLPRLHFSGTFRASPSTINNVDANWNAANPASPLWNPRGAHEFQILRGNEVTLPLGANIAACTITAVCGTDGQYTTSDPIVGKPVVSTNAPSTGKLVDLDVDQQGVSQIWGMELSVADVITAPFVVVFFRQLFGGRNAAPAPGSMPFSAAYQSVLAPVQWPMSLDSPVLRALREASPDMLSICFVVDSYSPQSTGANGVPNPRFTLGRVAGTIGPANKREPQFYPAPGRLLRPVTSGARESAADTLQQRSARMKALEFEVPVAAREAIANPTFNYAWAAVDKNRRVATFDLGNSLQFDGANAGDVGKLQAAILTSGDPVILGDVANTLDNYRNRAWIFDFPLTQRQLELAMKSRLAILRNGTPVLAENTSGAFVEANDHVVRMDANTSATISFRANKFGGAPPPGQQLVVTASPNDGVLTITPSTVPIAADGSASVKVTAGDPSGQRSFIDGQVYTVGFSWSQDTNPDENAFVAVKVYDAINMPATPDWSDVQPIFVQLMHLYPSMQTILNLADEQTVKNNAKLIRDYMSLPPTNPRFMPVTRDLSGPKTKMILAYLESLL